jgi:CBS domain containing-hemolysin-like protein
MIPLFVTLAAAGLLFFSLLETAFGLFMRLPERLEAEREGDHGPLQAYLDDPLKFFVPVRLLRGSMLVLVVVLLAQPIGTGWTRGLALFASGFAFVFVVGQLLPALIVRKAPERYLDILLPPFTVIANLVGPITALIRGWLGSSDRGNGHETSREGEPASGLDAGPTEPVRDDGSRLLRSVVDFGNTLVREVMTPRPDIVAIPASASIDDLRRLVAEQEYSRLPVYDENLDNIVGLVVVKDLIQMPEGTEGTQPLTGIMRPAAFVPETKRVADLLREFQSRRFQLAIAVDEHGGTAGLVTIEDVVEELVGEIRDEYDSEVEPIVEDSDGVFTFSAKVGIDDFVERLGLEIEEGRFETVGGYVLSRVGRVPAVGERFRFDDLDVEILEAERRRIHSVRVARVEPETAESGHQS